MRLNPIENLQHILTDFGKGFQQILLFGRRYKGGKGSRISHGGDRSECGVCASLLQECSRLEALAQGQGLHGFLIKTGFHKHIFVGNNLVNIFSKCRSLTEARYVFDKMPERDVVSWTAMISGYVQSGIGYEALKLLGKMEEDGVNANEFTFATVIKACATLAALDEGKAVHGHIIRHGFHSNVVVSGALIGMYGKCGNITHARQVFDKMAKRDAISWTAMITAYAQNDHGEEALKLFCQLQEAGIKPDRFTFGIALSTCASLAALEQGKQVHARFITDGNESEVMVGTALVDMYAKCGQIACARQVFDKMSTRNVVSWTAIVAGYAQNGVGEEALRLFSEMQKAGMQQDQFAFSSALRACASFAALTEGKEVHACFVRIVFQPNVVVESALVDMYAKCGSLKDARNVFDKMSEQNVVSWNVMIGGCAQHGQGKEALKLFAQMLQGGIKPDYVTFVGVLSACSHAGLVDEGYKYLNSMCPDYGLTPTVEHCSCIVDLLGRAGHLKEAEDFINKMQLEPDAIVWGSLLGACRNHANMDLARRVAERVIELLPQNDATYVLLSNIYAASGRWDDVAKVRAMMKDRGIKKRPGCSWIEVKNRMHTFVVGENLHLQKDEIYAMLERLAGQMKEAGHVPDMNQVMHDVEQEEKEHLLGHHSEKLAIGFGLINTPPGTTLRILKNLRVCLDCHTSAKFISEIVGREIVLRDANRFHHFKNGHCSCRDYW